MYQTASKRSPWAWFLFGIIGLFGLAAFMWRKNPQRDIRSVLTPAGLSERAIRYWTAVSAFETDGWKSNVFKQSNNAFNIIVPGSIRLAFGEGQTVYKTVRDSVVGLVDHVLKPFLYPRDFDSLEQLVRAMKLRGYFTSDEGRYLAGVRIWFRQLYPNDLAI